MFSMFKKSNEHVAGHDHAEMKHEADQGGGCCGGDGHKHADHDDAEKQADLPHDETSAEDSGGGESSPHDHSHA